MQERTLVLIKPDGVERGHTGDILSRFERTGLKIAGMKMVWPKKDDVNRHYTLTDEWVQGVFTKAKQKYEALGQHFPYGDAKTYGAAIKTGLMDFLQSGPVVAMVLEGEQSVTLVRKLVGATEPASAAPGTIRGDLSLDSYALSNSQNRPLRNLIHASGTVEEAQNEIAVWFTADELHDYPHSLTNILYDPLHFTPKKRPKGS
ncbi:nucleoside-diphosphate kinase [Candidatus Peregrinibacteria bacterium]|nr:nucleoside-diphosphate kinase [Candidatus Peregrinibacteria bacterium]